MKNMGFTLIELLIVVALIMILSAVGVGGYLSAVSRSRDTQRKNDLNQYAKGLESFYADVGRYPTSDGGRPVCFDMSNPSSPVDTVPCDKLRVKSTGEKYTDYITVPKDPDSPSQKYYYTSDGASFALYTAIQNLEDKDLFESGGSIVNYESLDGVDCGQIPCNYKITEVGLVKSLE